MTPRIIPFPSPGSRGPKKNGSGTSRYFPLGAHESWYIFLQAMLITGIVGFMIFATPGYKISPQPFDILFGGMLLYWAFIHRQIQRSGFIKKNWILLLILVVIFAILNPWQMGVLIASVVLYLLFFGKSAYGPSSFVRYHILCLLIGFSIILWEGLLFSAITSLLTQLLHLLPFDSLTFITHYLQMGIWYGCLGLIVISGSILGCGALIGRAPSLPFVTRQAIYWA